MNYNELHLFISSHYSTKKGTVCLRPQIAKDNHGGRSYTQSVISNSTWTEWSTIQGVIARVILKSDEREARGRFEITSTITPWIVRHEVQLLINRIYNKFRN